MEALSGLTPEGIVGTASVYGGIGILSLIRYLFKKRGSKLRALIVGPECGKSRLCESFNDNYSDEGFYLLDLEGLFQDHDSKIPKIVKDELLKLKGKDSVLYMSRVAKLYRDLLSDILPTLKSMKKTIIVVLSNRDIAKQLKIKQRLYLTGNQALFKQQLQDSDFKQYLHYCRKSMKVAKTVLFKDYDDLYQKVKTYLGVKDRL